MPSFAADVDWSGEVRVRYEQKDNWSDLDKDKGDLDRTTGQRTTINAKVAIDDQTTGFISIRDARNWGSENATNKLGSTVSTADEDQATDLSEGYLDVKNLVGPVGLKIGRQKLAYGNQRLIGHLEWTDWGRRFDAIKLNLKTEPVDVDFVTAKLSDNANETEDQLNFIYATLKVIPQNKLDVYAIQSIGGGDYTNAVGWTVHNNQNFLTTGLRLAGKAAGADWTAEFAKQSGDDKAEGTDINASAFAVTGGYTLPVLGGLRIGGEVFSGSGDDNSADKDNEAWQNLYPTNHFHYGISDFANTNWQNNTGAAVKVSMKPAKGLSVKIERWQMETTEDTGTKGGVETVESNIQVKYKLTEKTGLYVYYAMVDVEDDNAAAGAAEDQATKLGIQIAAKF
ncbi:MAG: alginate export family protein [Deltaproteobacteria bacterium]|nr:alginate export family protein [Deltaproteobacteria bacterium]